MERAPRGASPAAAAKRAFCCVVTQRARKIVQRVQVERRIRAVARVAVHEGEKGDLLAFGLKLRGNCVRYKPAE